MGEYHDFHLNCLLNGSFLRCIWISGEGEDKKLPPPFSKICHKYSTNETRHSYTLPKKDSKCIWITWHTSWVLLTIEFFHRSSENFSISKNTDIDWVLEQFLILLISFETLISVVFNNFNKVLISVVTIVMVTIQ